MIVRVVQAPFPDWGWLSNPRTLDRLQRYTAEHLEFTVLSVAIGFAVALLLAILAVRYRRLYTPLLGLTGVLFTIPSLALFMTLGALYGSPLACLGHRAGGLLAAEPVPQKGRGPRQRPPRRCTRCPPS